MLSRVVHITPNCYQRSNGKIKYRHCWCAFISGLSSRQEDVCMLPDNVSSVLGLRIGRKYRIGKYIYGLPDSGLAYYNRYSELLIEDGYKRTRSDPCLFVRVTSEERTYVWIHVDDTFICSNERKFIDRFCDCLRKNFKITINEQVSQYLGIKIED